VYDFAADVRIGPRIWRSLIGALNESLFLAQQSAIFIPFAGDIRAVDEIPLSKGEAAMKTIQQSYPGRLGNGTGMVEP
jgi:hypothetical protein